MASSRTAVFGIVSTRSGVENAVDELKAAGFRNADISVLMPHKTGDGPVTGAGTGAVIGGALGWLAGIGLLAIPAFGPFIAAGPLMSLLAGAGVGGAVGDVSGALMSFGIPEHDARRYEGSVKNGGILLSVHCESAAWAALATELLERSGAQDIGTSPDLRTEAPRRQLNF